MRGWACRACRLTCQEPRLVCLNISPLGVGRPADKAWRHSMGGMQRVRAPPCKLPSHRPPPQMEPHRTHSRLRRQHPQRQPERRGLQRGGWVGAIAPEHAACTTDALAAADGRSLPCSSAPCLPHRPYRPFRTVRCAAGAPCPAGAAGGAWGVWAAGIPAAAAARVVPNLLVHIRWLAAAGVVPAGIGGLPGVRFVPAPGVAAATAVGGAAAVAARRLLGRLLVAREAGACRRAWCEWVGVWLCGQAC